VRRSRSPGALKSDTCNDGCFSPLSGSPSRAARRGLEGGAARQRWALPILLLKQGLLGAAQVGRIVLGDDNQCQVPLLLLNREAHSLASSWLAEHWHDFCSKPGDRQGVAKLLNQQHTIPNAVTKYAVSEKLFMQVNL
ncbi:hypothetical protein LLEC1_02513, partial [Akanthomyces lecanii]